MHINEIISNITKNCDYRITPNNMNKLIKYLKIVSKTCVSESVLPICENLILKVKR